MAIQLVFSKIGDAPWGFRLTGGADCEIPLTVIKIVEEGVADLAGLRVGDVILKINEHPTEELSHIEAHDVLMEAGLNFIMTVFREHINIHDDEQHNEEVRNILKQSFEDEFQEILSQNGYPEHVAGKEQVLLIQPQQKGLRVRFDDEINQDPEPTQNEPQNEQPPDLQQKKWSTFLQKPKRAAVQPKKKDEDAQIGEPYRVIIKKQPKKDPHKIVKECVDVLPSDNEVEENVAPIIDDVDVAENEIEEEHVSEYEEEPQAQQDLEELTTDNESEVIDDTPDVEEDLTELEEQLTLEEKLAQIQQQLKSLSQVPTSIQDTLEALTDQLAKIVGVPQTQQNFEEDTVEYKYNDEEDEEDHSFDDVLTSITEEAVEVLDSNDEYKLDATDISEDENEHEISNIISAEEELKLREAEEHEKELQQLEAEKAAKLERNEEFHQRRLEQRPTIPLAPVQRPIILPGGRKWSEPDDALPKPRKSKMTDEKICETLDNYSEIVTGHTKGINFLKYQPAPKNLDYLQRSEVFRLVHDMDPPQSGIAARSGKVVSEEDYYQNNAGFQTSVKV